MSTTKISKVFMGAVLAGGMLFTSAAFGAEVVVRVAPPHAIVERRGVAPGRGYVWIPGYHRWDGAAYVWTAGRWDRPPHPGARWVAHRWVRNHDGYVLQEGHWR